jgi:hypothetical protein
LLFFAVTGDSLWAACGRYGQEAFRPDFHQLLSDEARGRDVVSNPMVTVLQSPMNTSHARVAPCAALFV